MSEYTCGIHVLSPLLADSVHAANIDHMEDQIHAVVPPRSRLVYSLGAGAEGDLAALRPVAHGGGGRGGGRGRYRERYQRARPLKALRHRQALLPGVPFETGVRLWSVFNPSPKPCCHTLPLRGRHTGSLVMLSLDLHFL